MKKKCSQIVFLLLLVMIAFVSSCDKMDDYKKYIEDNLVVSYTGKIDSVKIYSGENRVLIEGLLISDPKITEVRMYWNNRQDSISVPVQRTSGVDTIRQYITGLGDGVYNFEIVTFDNEGNRSIRVSALGRSYGEIYKAGMVNRPLSSGRLITYANTLTATFGGLDLTSGIYATDIHYTDNNGISTSVRLPIEESNIDIDDVDYREPVSYRSVYVPDSLTIDTFYTDYSILNPEFVFYRNLESPFDAHNISGRWGVISDWFSNDAANGISGRGSTDSNTGVRLLAAEAGWGTPNVPNGKIYQTTTLPAGRYRVTIDFTRNNVTYGDDNLIYFVANTNGEIPNAVDVESSDNLGFYDLRWFADGYQLVSFEFDNPTTQDVTIGFVVNFTSDSNQFFNVRGLSVTLIE